MTLPIDEEIDVPVIRRRVFDEDQPTAFLEPFVRKVRGEDFNPVTRCSAVAMGAEEVGEHDA